MEALSTPDIQPKFSLLMGATVGSRVVLQLGSPQTCASRSNVALPNTTQGPILSKESAQLPKRCAFLSHKLHRVDALVATASRSGVR